MAILVPCLVALRAEFNRLSPARDKGADGWIGDAAHALTASDHNPDETGVTPYSDADLVDEVHAIDIDKDLGGGLDLDDYVEAIRLRHLRGEDNRLQNIIWRARICSRTWGWTWKPYTGASAHFDHAHFSARYTTAQESDTSPWGVFMSLTDADKTWFKETIDARVGDVVHRYVVTDGKIVLVPETDPNPRMMASSALQYIQLTALQNQLALKQLLGLDPADEDAIVKGVLAGLTAPDRTAEQVADALRPVLGDRAAEVGRLLAGA